MKQLLLCICMTCPCWGQAEPTTSVEATKPIFVKLEAGPRPSIWQLPVVQGGLGVVLGAFLTLLGGLAISRQQRKHEMLKWYAEKQLDVLSRVSQLIGQNKQALRNRDEKWKRAVKLREVSAPSPEIAGADIDSAEADKALALRRGDLAALIDWARFQLPAALWDALQFFDQSFTDVCVNEKNTDIARAAQLGELDQKINAFNSAARREFESKFVFLEQARS
jgi:hypothetical protein